MNAELIFFATPLSGSWLVDIIVWIVKISSSIALGVVIFTILLKLVTLPFDVISKVQTRKNALIMEAMRPDLEKLQKQYAGDKQLYNQKMMALYKKNGYSMFGACLPTIVTLVIFIVAINAFTNYSKFQNKKYFYDMSLAYNTAVYDGLDADGDFVKKELVVENSDKLYELVFDNAKIVEKAGDFTANGINYKVELKDDNDGNGKYYTISSENGYVYYKQYYTDDNIAGASGGEYFVIPSALKLETDLKITDGKNFDEYVSASDSTDESALAVKFLSALGSKKSAEQFRSEGNGKKFLWVQNIWAVDSPLTHPVDSEWEATTTGSSCGSCFGGGTGFKTAQTYKANDGQYENMNAERYSLLIADLTEEQNTPNGYFILSVITAVMAFLTQLVLGKSQKAAMELQTVDGRGAQQQKMMMWMMPVMLAIFSFMYTATFSIYMILSQALSIVATFGINFVIDKKFGGKGGEKAVEKIRGRIHTPEVKEEPKKDAKNIKRNEPDKPDFINGGKPHVRGRIK